VVVIPPAEKLKPVHEPVQGEIASLSWLDDVDVWDVLKVWLSQPPPLLIDHTLVSTVLKEGTCSFAV
jgi:hypothetical protein